MKLSTIDLQKPEFLIAVVIDVHVHICMYPFQQCASRHRDADHDLSLSLFLSLSLSLFASPVRISQTQSIVDTVVSFRCQFSI